MKRVEWRIVACFGAVVLVAVTSGCQEKQTIGLRSPTPRATGKLGPEESFEVIVETFRRGVEDVRIRFRTTHEGGHSMMSGRNQVTHELIRPVKDGDPYKGVIVVDSESNYSIQRSSDRDEGSKSGEESNRDEPTGLDPIGDPSGTDILDSDLVSTPSGGGTKSRPRLPTGDSVVSRRPDQFERKYELLYANGRWELVTELDKETEQSIDNAFKQALKTQLN